MDGFDPAAFALHPVGVGTWGGFVFLHLTPAEAAPLADQLGPAPPSASSPPHCSAACSPTWPSTAARTRT